MRSSRALHWQGYHTLQLIHYYTSGPDECRCWTIRDGWMAPKAAGTIHTDFERGFIKAEVYNYKVRAARPRTCMCTTTTQHASHASLTIPGRSADVAGLGGEREVGGKGERGGQVPAGGPTLDDRSSPACVPPPRSPALAPPRSPALVPVRSVWQGKAYVVKDKDIIFFKFNVTADAKKK
jgi:hypothetical protein